MSAKQGKVLNDKINTSNSQISTINNNISELNSSLNNKQTLIQWQDIFFTITVNASDNSYYDLTASDVKSGQNIFDVLISLTSWELIGKLDNMPGGNIVRIIFYNPTNNPISCDVSVRVFYY